MSEQQKIDDGGQAFPTSDCSLPDESDIHPGQDGMSLRDHFAAAALQGMLASESKGEGMTKPCVVAGDYCQRNADYAYEWADAMLAARKVRP